MSFGPALDDAIGLVLVYLMLSILVTTISEAIASVLNKRGKDLYAALINLTDGIVYALPAPAPDGATTAAVADHPLIQNNTPGSRKASYVSARNFALAILDSIGALDPAATIDSIQASIDKLAPSTVKQTLSVLVKKAGQTAGGFQTDIETWFNDAMDRLSGDYKRWSQRIGLGIAMAAAIIFNASTFNIAETLWTDAHVRDAMVTVASKQTMPTPNADATFKDIQQAGRSVADLPLPLGWGVCAPATQGRAGDDQKPFLVKPLVCFGADVASAWTVANQAGLWSQYWGEVGLFICALLVTAVGWAFTGVAVSLGAPFWFDTLQKLVNVRSTGPKPGSKTSASAASAAGTAPS